MLYKRILLCFCHRHQTTPAVRCCPLLNHCVGLYATLLNPPVCMEPEVGVLLYHNLGW